MFIPYLDILRGYLFFLLRKRFFHLQNHLLDRSNRLHILVGFSPSRYAFIESIRFCSSFDIVVVAIQCNLRLHQIYKNVNDVHDLIFQRIYKKKCERCGQPFQIIMCNLSFILLSFSVLYLSSKSLMEILFGSISLAST